MNEHQADKAPLDSDATVAGAPSIVPSVSDASTEAGKTEGPAASDAKADLHGAAPSDVKKPTAEVLPTRIMVIPNQRGGMHDGETIDHDRPSAAAMSGTRKLSVIAAIIAVAAVVGAVGGVLATAGFGHIGGDNAKAVTAENHALKDSIARLDAEVTALKTSLDRTGKARTAQFAKVGERLEKVEKAQDDTGAKLTKLGEAQEKLRTAAAAPPPAPKETTASIAVPKPEAPKPQILEGWILRDVADGGATIEGRTGIYEVYPGDPLPGLNRVQAVRKQDGRWVVVTAKGLIVAR